MPFGRAEILDQGARFKRRADVGENLLRIFVHRVPVDAAFAHRLPTHVDILGRRNLVKHGGFLVDGGDPGAAGRMRVFEDQFGATHLNLPFFRVIDAGEDLDQR